MSDFEEYQLFVNDTARLSDRRQTVTNTYITVNGAIITLMAFLVKDSRPISWWPVLALLPLVSFGAVVCFHWWYLLKNYRRLVGLRLKVLREMESKLTNSIQMYHREDELYPPAGQGHPLSAKGLNFSDLESHLPLVFLALYLVLVLALAAGTLLVTIGVLPKP